MAKSTLGVCGEGVCGEGVGVIWLTLHHYSPLSAGQTLKAGQWRQQLSRGHGDALCINLSSTARSASFLVPLRTNFPGWLNRELGPLTSIFNQGNVLQICLLANPMEAIVLLTDMPVCVRLINVKQHSMCVICLLFVDTENIYFFF